MFRVGTGRTLSLLSWGVFQLTEIFCWGIRNLQQENKSFHSEQETIFHSLITPAGWENRQLFSRKYSSLAFSRKEKPLTKIWAWFWAYGPQVPVCSGWDFTGSKDRHSQRNTWIHHGYFCSTGVGKVPSQELSALAALGYLRLDDSLGVTSSCFPPFPPLGPSHLRGLAGLGRLLKLLVSI